MAKIARPELSDAPAFDEQQGAEYAAYIDCELADEHSRRTRFQSRAQSLITTSAILLTFMGAIAVFAQFAQRYVVSGWLQGLYGVAMLALVVAVGCGIWAGRGYVYDAADDSVLHAMVESHWGDNPVDARNIVATLRVAAIVTLRKGNDTMARFVLFGQYAQLVFVILFAIAALLTITSAERIAGDDLVSQ